MEKMPLDSKKNKKVNVKITFNKNKNKINNNSINNSNLKLIENDFPTEEELYKNRRERKQNLSKIKIKKIDNEINNDADENIISINLPKKNLNCSFQQRINNTNQLNLNFNQDNNSNNKLVFSKNINISNIHKINNKNSNRNDNCERIIDKKIPHPNINININLNKNIAKKNKTNGIVKLNNHRIKIGNDIFEDLTKEARDLQNKEAYEKKILGITQESYINNPPPKKPFLEKIGDFFTEHQDGFRTVLDGIGCIVLYKPSIDRTLDRIDRWVGGPDDVEKNEENNIQNDNQNILLQKSIRKKNKDYETIIKFLPIWEITENKKRDNNNNCVVCLYEFKIGERISTLPCLHIFHCDCINNWLKNELTCPVCKFEVTLSSIIGKYNT